MSSGANRPTPVAIIAGNRVPFGRAGGGYRHETNLNLLTTVLDGLLHRHGLDGERLGLVAGGAVLKHSRDFNLTREAVLASRLCRRTPALDVQQACATSLQAACLIGAKIAAQQLESGIACGVDSVSDAPVAVHSELRRILLEVSRARTTRARLQALARLRPGHLVPEWPPDSEPTTGLTMGEHMAVTAADWRIGRQAQDELAAASHHNLAAAYERGFFDDLVTAHRGLSRDENLRPATSLEQLGRLKPVFGTTGSDPTLTAGNSTALSDGAAAVLLGSHRWAAEHDLPVLANLLDSETAAVDFVDGPDGLLMAPVHAVPPLLARHGLTLQDFDFYEIHEAFASTVLATLAAWQSPEFCRDRLGLDAPLGEIDRSRLNVVGSSLATVHPFAATGARILATAAKLLHEKGSGRALITVCAAGGQGVAAIVEAA